MNEPNQRIALTGFMGAGKTSVARSLAERLGYRMIDMDQFIESREGRAISSIITQDGEARFREIETAALADVLEDDLVRVIALGGGTWTIAENRSKLKTKNCFTVWLDAPFELCWERIGRGDNERPLARDKQETRALYESRCGAYELADARIEVTADMSSEAVSDQVIVVCGI